MNRKTTQFLAPTKFSATPKGVYDVFPAFPMGSGKIKEGVYSLVEEIIDSKVVIIDGYVGVFWSELANMFEEAYNAMGKRVRVRFTSDYMFSPEKIDNMVAPYLNEPENIFGRITDLELKDWFEESLFSMELSESFDVEILIGCGASLSNLSGRLLYVDLPKNELQFRMRAQSVHNLGAAPCLDNRQTYKRSFFVDWVVLNNYKSEILPNIEYMIDAQRVYTPLYTKGDDLREALANMSKNFLRVRPWFEPGAWGGTWMRDNIKNLNSDVPNLAWSFELMSLENGLMFESDGYRLEVSFDTLMFAEYENVLGKCAGRFKYDFPIRFDFLDTFDGGNLSIQCHPAPEYIKSEFNMPFTQDETYYILDCKNEPNVYLGLQGNIDKEEFASELYRSQNEAEDIDIERFVQKHPAKKHDLFLIPNGTIHGSGKDNMVLEISSAPYIFTFKMYDWMRVDLDGRPRPINIAHGLKNIDYSLNGEIVKSDLISKPYVKVKTDSFTHEVLPTHPRHFYEICRLTINSEIDINTNNHAHVCMLVEGQSVIVETACGMKQRFNYAETFIIPAAAGSYKVYNESLEPVMLVVSHVKDECCTN